MTTMRGFWTVACGVALTVLAAAAPARAQGDRPAGPADALATKQQMIRDRLARLEDRMFRLREKLNTAEPENARRLEAALAQAGALDVKARVDRLIASLQDPSRLDAPIAEQEKLVADLEAVLGVLLDRTPDDGRRRAELERLAEIKENLDRVIDEQIEQRRSAARAVQAQRLAKRIADAADDLEKLKSAQAELMERPDGDPQAAPANPPAGAEQTQLAGRAAALQREVEQLSRRLAELQEANAEEAPTDATPGDAESDPLKQPKSGPLDDAAESVEGAQQDMQQAADEQKAGDAAEAKPEQQAAIEKLARAIQRLQEEQQKLAGGADKEPPAQEQRRVAGETQKLAEQMKPPAGGEGAQPDGGQPNENGQQSPQNSQNSPQSGKPSPGQENVERARQHMDDAADKLDEQDTEQAILEQDKALDELERAQRELEETLKQLRREEQEEALAGLEARIRDMLEKQTAINTETEPLAALGAANFTRSETLKCAELADRQREVSEAAGASVRLLEEDGTTVVFPNMMRQLQADTRTIAERLAAAEVGPLTGTLQADAHAALTELLDAIKKLREKMQQDKQSGPAGGGAGAAASAPLVPTSAELKLLKNSQVRINRQTEAADDAGSDAAAILQRCAAQQKELLEMARGMQDRAEKEMQP